MPHPYFNPVPTHNSLGVSLYELYWSLDASMSDETVALFGSIFPDQNPKSISSDTCKEYYIGLLSSFGNPLLDEDYYISSPVLSFVMRNSGGKNTTVLGMRVAQIDRYNIEGGGQGGTPIRPISETMEIEFASGVYELHTPISLAPGESTILQSRLKLPNDKHTSAESVYFADIFVVYFDGAIQQELLAGRFSLANAHYEPVLFHGELAERTDWQVIDD